MPNTAFALDSATIPQSPRDSEWLSTTVEPLSEVPDSNDLPRIVQQSFLSYSGTESLERKSHASSVENLRSTTELNAQRVQRSPTTLLAEWNGCVTSVNVSHFSASLKGIYGEGVRGEGEDAEIPISDVSAADIELLQPGNFFRLCVLHEIREDGQPRRYTQVVFRRLPAYRTSDLRQADDDALELARSLSVE